MNIDKRWLFVPIGLLLVNAAIMVVLVVASSWHPPEVVPQYYERAVAWDQAVAEAKVADDLGWKIDCALAPGGAMIRARDGAGHPVANAHVQVSGFHRGQPKHRAQFEVITDASGTAHAVPRDGARDWSATPGWYEVEIAVKRGPISYAMHRSVELVAALDAPAAPAATHQGASSL